MREIKQIQKKFFECAKRSCKAAQEEKEFTLKDYMDVI